MKSRIYILLLLLIVNLAPAAVAEDKSIFDKGMDNFKKEKYSLAVKDFRAALDENPREIGYRFYYALALYYDDKLDDSKFEFQEIIKQDKDSSWGKISAMYIKNIECGIFAPDPERDLAAMLSFSYETNDNTAYTPFLIDNGWDNKGTAQFSTTLKPLIFSSRPITLSINTFGSEYQMNKDFNEYGCSGDFSISLPLFFNTFTTLSGGKEFYYQHQEPVPYYTNDFAETMFTFKVFPDTQAWTTVYIGGSRNLYSVVSYEGYNADNATFGIRQNLNTLTYISYDNKNSDTKSTDYANISDEYTIGATIPLPMFFKLFISEKIINKGYRFVDSVGGIKRRDTAYIFDFYLTKEILNNLLLGGRYTYTNYSSNLDKSHTALSYGSYVGHILSASLSYNF